MKYLNKDCFNPFFSHIYVEHAVLNHPRTRKILAAFPNANVIEIAHYKEIFCRSRQNYILQHRTQKLILAAKDTEGTLIYQGSEVCQNFGNEHFYYTSCVMNCIYDCEYCYLKGMYPSANIVIFINIEDLFREAERLMQKHKLYLCVSYDTDLPALEQIAGYAGEWCRFAEANEQRLKIEIRTKCADRKFFENQKPLSNVVYAFTLSPREVIRRFEHYTPSLAERIRCAAQAVQDGFLVRLCFDPVIYLSGWQKYYDEMLDDVFRVIEMDRLADVSVGTFRISQDYLKKMRKQEPDSAAVWFPYQLEQGFYQYPDDMREQMEQYLVKRLTEQVPREKIFLWKTGDHK